MTTGADPRGSEFARLGYRPALDGLRAVAVGMVLLYHAGYDFMAFGFLGVDLFFVLSGYLVTRVILLAVETDTFSLMKFYERRVRRLLPAATVVLLAMLWFLFLAEPEIRRRDLIPDLQAASLYFANWRFVSASTDYFASELDQSPFLHFWSLAIEEQFYFVFPALLVGSIALARRVARPSTGPVVMVGLFVGSVFRQIQVAADNPLQAYYATDARLYQLLGGVLLAWWLHGVKLRSDRPRRGVELLGIGAMASLVVLAVASPVSISTAGFLAGIAAVSLILALEVAPQSVLARLLSVRPLVYCGAISYGIYLWHWPLMVLTRRSLGDSPALLMTVGGLGSVALAALSLQLIERPAKTVLRDRATPRLVVAAGLATSLVVGLAIGPLALNRSGVPALDAFKPTLAARSVVAETSDSVTVTSDEVDVGELDLEGFRAVSTGAPNCIDLTVSDCVLVQGPDDDALRIALHGDSLAAKLVPMMSALAVEEGFTFLASTAFSCPWQNGIAGFGNFAVDCAAMKKDFHRRVVPEFEPDVVLILTATRDDPTRFVELVPMPEFDGLTQARLVDVTTVNTLRMLRDAVDSVVLVEPVPVPVVDPIECLSGAAVADDCDFAASPGPFAVETIYRAAAVTIEGVEVLSIDGFACPDLPRCAAVVDGLPPFVDRIHIFSEYALAQRRSFWDLAEELLAPSDV